MLRFSAWTDVGRVRAGNQDAYCLHLLDGTSRRALLAVADGMGGHSGGEVASTLAARRLEEAVLRAAPGWSTPGACLEGLRAAVLEAHAAIKQAQAAMPAHADMGTTLTAVLVWGELLYVAHSGDSRAYLVSGGRIRRLTDDHSVVAELVRSGHLTEEEARGHPQRHFLTSALGVHGPVRVDLLEASWQPGDVVLLCSDGLTNAVADDEIARHAADTSDFAAVARRLVDLANQRGGHDNITVVAAWWER